VVEDEYLWVPECRINIKLRKGIENGLKFKRLEKVEGDFELWLEDPAELYPYTKLTPSLLRKVAVVLNIKLPQIPDGPYDREKTLVLLQAAEPRPSVITVNKRRQTRVFDDDTSRVKVEIAEVLFPQTVWSIALENDSDLERAADSGQ